MANKMHLSLDESGQPTHGPSAFADSVSPIWADFDFDEWTVALRIQSRDGRPVLTDVWIHPTRPSGRPSSSANPIAEVPAGGIPAAFVKNLTIGALRDRAFQQLTDPTHPNWQDNWPEPVDNYYDIAHYGRIDVAAEGDTPTRPGRRPLTDSRLAAVARHYVDAVREGNGTTKHIQARLESEGDIVSLGTVTSRVSKARRRGFLSPASEPARITDKARRVLSAAENQDKEET